MIQIFILMLFICSLAYAEDYATHSGTKYTGCQAIGDTRITLNNPDDYSTVKDGYIYLPDGCKSITIPSQYRKVENKTVVEMTQAEKDAIDAAILQQQQADQTKNTEIQTLISTLETDYNSFDGYTTAQKLTAIKRLLRSYLLTRQERT